MRLKKFSKENSSVAEKAIEQFSTLIYQAKLKARVRERDILTVFTLSET